MWTQARITAYLLTALGMGGTILAAMGYATFDKATGQIDLAPFNLYWVAAPVAGVIAPALAAVAAKMGWGRK